jgi:hypothetical protein
VCNRRLHDRPLRPPRRLHLPLAPIKGCGPHPVLATPIPSLLPSSPSSSITTSEPLCHRRFAIITVLPSPRPTLISELLSSGVVGGQAPASVPPRSTGHESAPPPHCRPSSGEQFLGRAASPPSRGHPCGKPSWPRAAARPSSDELPPRPCPRSTMDQRRPWSMNRGLSPRLFPLENNLNPIIPCHFA